MAEDSARQRFANYMRLPETAEEECEGLKHKQILKNNTTSTRRLNDANIYDSNEHKEPEGYAHETK